MEDSLFNLGLLMGGILALIPEILIFIAILFFLNKEKSIHAILMIIGTSLAIILTIYSSWIIPLIISEIDSNFAFNVYQNSLLGLLSIISAFSFSIGFFLMFHKNNKKGKSSEEQLISRIEKINDPDE
jgi:ABC-type multidrug transport system fused ATPase/permease subunit